MIKESINTLQIVLLTPTIFTLPDKILHNTLIHGHFQHQIKHCQS